MKNGLFHKKQPSGTPSQCLKFTEKVSFNIASEASYVYILSQTVLPDNFNETKIGGKCRNSNATFQVIFKQCAHCGKWEFSKLSSMTKLNCHTFESKKCSGEFF